jgi:hypothetical protein
MGAAEASTEQQLKAEIDRLRARVEALESELVEVQARANAAVAEWQERAYWLDRLHIDLNAVMRRPGANQLRLALKGVRTAYWQLKLIKRRLFKQQ